MTVLDTRYVPVFPPVAKGHLVWVYSPTGARRYVPPDWVGRDAVRPMTADELIERIRQADDRTLALLRGAIEAEIGQRERIAAELEDDQEDDGDDE